LLIESDRDKMANFLENMVFVPKIDMKNPEDPIQEEDNLQILS